VLTRFIDIRDALSLTKGWRERDWEGQRVLTATFGGNEMRFRVEGTRRLILRIVTEPFVFCHVHADGKHVAKIRPEASPASIDVPVKAEGTEISIVRTAVSSGSMNVDAMVIDAETEDGARFLPPTQPVPTVTFATFGDSISGNCCIGDDPPFDPYGLGYGYQIADRFGWQYFSCARDGSGVSCRPFANPLAIERVDDDLIRFQPEYLLVFYGTNDIRNGVTCEVFRRDFEILMRRIVERLPNTRIATSGLLWNEIPSESEIIAFSNAIREVSALLGVPFCDPRAHVGPQDIDDGVHPNGEGQRKLAQFFGDELATHWALFPANHSKEAS